MRYRIFDGRSIRSCELEHDVITALDRHPYGHHLYFELSGDFVLCPVQNLIATRARPEGIVNASKLMKQAACGQQPKRAPITVDKWRELNLIVLDGNSTFLNALYSGWADIPCTIRNIIE